MGPDKLVDVPGAAKWLGGVSVWTVRAWLRQGRLQRVKVGSRTMIWESELKRFVGYEEPAAHGVETVTNKNSR